MAVDLGGPDRRVAQEPLDLIDRDPSLDEEARKRVPERMEMQSRVEAGGTDCVPEGPADVVPLSMPTPLPRKYQPLSVW